MVPKEWKIYDRYNAGKTLSPWLSMWTYEGRRMLWLGTISLQLMGTFASVYNILSVSPKLGS